ncbi:MAG: 1-acyl-sn-glycerol-3-phosphate acyltransferase, partial [Planctomycetes bacterium]|nr:1-acyl-sn-glycerol-3-phosphate acyltransferase [Planctomycetota bacterium]
MPQSQEIEPLPPSKSRNAVWRTMQFICQNFFCLWLQYRAHGQKQLDDADGGGLVVANHQSFLDPLLVGLQLHRPISYVARDSLFRVPVVGWVLRNTYVMPI